MVVRRKSFKFEQSYNKNRIYLENKVDQEQFLTR